MWFQLAILVSCWLVFTGWPLYCTWKRAQQLHLPLIVTPIPRGSFLQQSLEYALAISIFPSWLTQLPFVRVSVRSWTFKEKFRIHRQYGRIFAVVTPTTCEIYVADAKAAKQILHQRTAFLKPNRLLAKLEYFGQNLATVEGEQWRQHRRLASKAFHEKTYRMLWGEACRRAELLIQFWSPRELPNTQSDLATLSLDVLLKTCFNVDHAQGPLSTGEVPLQNQVEVYLRSLTDPRYMNSEVADISRLALSTFIDRLLADRSRSAKEAESDLLSAMLAATAQDALSEKEITGNLFLFIFAGHETTASALSYILHLFAVFPNWQHWAGNEVDSVLCTAESGSMSPFEAVFPRLKRLRAVLYETIRLYGPVPTIVRSTGDESQTLSLQNGEVTIPGNMSINVNCMALHTDPGHWGQDSLDWNPARWISTSEDELFVPVSNHFFGWGAGPRICPGQKFSQVEIIAVLVCILKNHRVVLVPQGGQTMDETRGHAVRLIESSSVALTLQMPDAKLIRIILR
ncbi:cytochrome P450 monooxygenase [Aspergillus aurantiobrunneus]